MIARHPKRWCDDCKSMVFSRDHGCGRSAGEPISADEIFRRLTSERLAHDVTPGGVTCKTREACLAAIGNFIIARANR